MVWLRIALIFIIVWLLNLLVKFILSKILKIEKVSKKFFSYNYINESHRKIDKLLRTSTTIVVLFFLYMVIYHDYPFYAIVLPSLLISSFQYGVNAFFEWKHTQIPKQAILTISEIIII